MTFDKDIKINLHDGAVAKDWFDSRLRDLMADHVERTCRHNASLREDEVRQIEASGRKVTRIEVDPDGNESIVSELLDYQSPPDDHNGYDSFDALKYLSANTEAPMGSKLEEVRPGIYVMDDPQFKAIDGPHMYNPDCYCMNCSGWHQKQNAGMHIDTEMVATEVELMVQRANDEWQRGGYKGECFDPIMHLPCSVVLALCEKAQPVKPDYCAEFALDLQNKALRREIAELKEGTVTSDGLGAAIRAGVEAADMFPGAVKGVSYSQETGDWYVTYSYGCECGIHHSNQTFPQNLPTYSHYCLCGKEMAVWDTERKG